MDSNDFSFRERRLLEASKLPPEVLDHIRLALDRSGLPESARLEVMEELVGHFQDGLAAGRTVEETLGAFGDAATLGKMLYRSRPEGRWPFRISGGILGRLVHHFGELSGDLRHALRGLRRSPGFTVIAVLTLALGIGANTAVFSVLNGVLLKALPYPNAREMVVAALSNPAQDVHQGPVGYADYLRWREEEGVFRSMGLFLDWNYNITAGEYPERVKGAVVTHGFFEVMGAPPLLGRTFAPREHEPGAGTVAILHEGIWRRRYGADPDIVGTTILLDGSPYQVVGVVPDGARWPGDAEVWTPLTFGSATPDWVLDLDAQVYSVVARLQPGIGLETAIQATDALARRAARERPDTRAGFGATLVPLRTHTVGETTERALWLLLGCSGFVLLIACANVGNLTLERSLSRQKEVSIRAALGAGRRRSSRPLAWECVLVAVLGGGVGTLVSVWGTGILMGLAPGTIPGIREVEVDASLLLFGISLSMATGLLFALAPSAALARVDLRRVLSEGGTRGARGPTMRRVRRIVTASQLALAVVLVLGAFLTARSTLGLLRVDPGFRPEGVLTMKVFLPHRPPTREETIRTADFYRELARGLEALPGAVSAAAISSLPLSSEGLFDLLPFHAGEGEPPSGGAGTLANWNIAGVGFFETLGIPLLAGREFSPDDNASGTRVAILSESCARMLFGGADPIGRQIRSTSGGVLDDPMEVVGVVGDVRYHDLADEGRAVVYVPQAQSAWRSMAVVARFQGDPSGRVEEARQVLRTLNPSVPATEVRPMTELTRASLATPRFAAVLVLSFAGLALALAAVGIYGVISVFVRQRYHELGIRKALGAEGTEMGILLLREGLGLTALGLLLGLPLAVALNRILSGFLFGVRPTEPWGLAAVAVLLGLTALVAAAVPAHRAARIDPSEALRGE